jgi:CDP-glucose 4,6-dehydratase
VEAVVSANEALQQYRGRRVLVTGHTGFKGSWLCLWLSRLGAEVSGLSDCVPTEPSHFSALGLAVDDRRSDINDAGVVARAMDAAKPDIVFHLAAQSLVRRAYADPLGTYRTNVVGTLNVLEAARRSNVGACVVATTDKVYRNDESGRRYVESDELGGSDPYSASKSCVELAVRSYRESFLRGGEMLVATVRAGNVVGGGDWAEDRLVPDLMRAAFGGAPVAIRNPESTRPWQHVIDVLAGYLLLGGRLLNREAAFADAWNIGPLDAAHVSVRAIIAAIRSQIPELQVEFEQETAGRHESGLLQLDSSKAMGELGWRPRWEGEMLDRTVDWYRAFYGEGRVVSVEQLAAFEEALA